MGAGHPVHLLHVVVLIGPVRSSGRTLHFQRRPFVFVQNQQVRNALQIVGVVLQDHGARKAIPDLLDQLVLILGFPHKPLSFIPKIKKREVDLHEVVLSIKRAEFFASFYPLKVDSLKFFFWLSACRIAISIGACETRW